jgi:hypothetical protein
MMVVPTRDDDLGGTSIERSDGRLELTSITWALTGARHVARDLGLLVGIWQLY